MYQAILFDLDGTLLPMDMETFTGSYFKLLHKRIEKYNISYELLVSSLWAGTKSMVKNDGSRKNKEAFWETFCALTGLDKDTSCDEFDDFYLNEFKGAKAATGENPLAVRAVELARQKAGKVGLATNPIFPKEGQMSRLGFVGLTVNDFDLVSDYSTDSYCKPNPQYYIDFCARLGVDPTKCLMIGNDETEDMYAGSLAGLQCYLITDCMIKGKNYTWEGQRGTFKDMVKMLEDL